MTEFTDRSALYEALHSAPGTAYINRSYSRGFSLNIFKRNAQELIEATRHIRDPDQGLRLMALDNKEAGEQAHKELNRLVHNFVTGAMTLIDHTRQFIREHYAGTDLKTAYSNKVKADFASEPIAKFVQDLRNYMVHKGLPSSHMFLNFNNFSSGPGDAAQLTTGIRYQTSVLLKWNGWTAPAKAYVTAAGEHLDIHSFAEGYLLRVLRFHHWLDEILRQFHAADLAELSVLQDAYARLSAKQPTSTPVSEQESSPTSFADEPVDETPFEFPADLTMEIDEVGSDVLSKIRPLNFSPSTTDEFPSEVPISTTLTPDVMRETPIVWRHDSNGQYVVTFLTSADGVFGLDADAYDIITSLTDKILELSWAKNSLSRAFVEETVISWLRSAFRSEDKTRLSTSLLSNCRDSVKHFEVWAPIAYLEVETPFELGPVQIAPITKAMIDRLENEGINYSPNQSEDVKALFSELRSRMQGLAAVVAHVEAEPMLVREIGMAIAQDAVGLLRFFCPVAGNSSRVSSAALLGMKAMPRSQALVLGEGYFSFTDHQISSPFFWRISKEHLVSLWSKGLAQASKLIIPKNLSELSRTVRTSLLHYATGTTLHNLTDRLVYTLAAVEGILLKHAVEATEFNIEERMSLLLGTNDEDRAIVARNVRETYRFRKWHNSSVLTPQDEDTLMAFTHNAYLTIIIALENLHQFETKADFIGAIEGRSASPYS